MKLFIYIFFVFFSILGYGQVTLFSETNTKEYEAKEPFKLNIGLEITGNHLEQQTPVKLPDLSKFEILGNASEVLSFVDPETGNIVRQVVYQLILEPKQSGKIKVGSALVQVNGKIYKSEPFDIFVRENNRKFTDISKDIFLSIEAKNDRVRYPHEPVFITLKVHSKNLHLFRKLRDIQLPKSSNFHSISMINNEIEQNNGDISSQTIATFIIFPESSGNFTIPPVLAKIDKEKVSSNTLKINIKPLPQGAPQHFTNAVGNFNLKIITPKKTAEINKPFDVFIKLSGEGNLNQINLPNILESEEYNTFKPKKNIKSIATTNGLKGELTAHYIIIPKKVGKINLLLEDFSFFNPNTNTYQTINENKAIPIHTENSEEREESTIEKIMDDTGHILKKTELLPINTKTEKKEINWTAVFIGIFIIGTLIGLFYIVFKRKNRKITHNQLEIKPQITTIAETEEIIKKSLFIGKDYYFRSMKKALDEGNSALFFEYYEELHSDAEEQVKLYEEKNIEEFITQNFDFQLIQEFKAFREKILIEKYSPSSQNLYEFYQSIEKFYSKIMK